MALSEQESQWVRHAWALDWEQQSAVAQNNERKVLRTLLSGMDEGRHRMVEPTPTGWQANTLLKQALVLYFRWHPNTIMQHGGGTYCDKVPLKFTDYNPKDWEALGSRLVPPATVRWGAYVGPRCVLMPCYVNIGAYIDEGALIDTWATVGSGAYIGRNVHLSGGVGIGGVLEPVQATPTVIEDGVFVGARSEVVEGVRVRRGAVLSMGVFLGQSTRIYDRVHDTMHQGEVPEDAVVVPGTLPDATGRCQLQAAIIVKYADAKTRRQLANNPHLRTQIFT